MMERWKDHKWIISGGNRSVVWGGACWTLGAVFAVLGVIADAINGTLGLESASWFLLAIAAFAGGISWYIGWAVAVYLEAKEAKKEE